MDMTPRLSSTYTGDHPAALWVCIGVLWLCEIHVSSVDDGTDKRVSFTSIMFVTDLVYLLPREAHDARHAGPADVHVQKAHLSYYPID